MLKVIFLVLVCLAFQSTAQAKTCNTVESIAWLVGDWHSENSKLKINESWKRVSNKTFEGYGSTYSVQKSRIVSSETLRLVEMSGEVFYFAKVASNELPVAFKLTSCSDKTAMFVNSKHDFPKKIKYQLTEDKNMHVFVSGEKGKGFSIKFTNKKDNS
ncbi:DUF6265 family protein [Pseudoalteromonas luteoviolacea]|uniref:DUF6265 domain-containing protein n=1 Tax=Pseudoalteromonas luteoviolacea DSM 6061 TaxID=1365250 RepID=A0A166XAG2_9GAMM|nr:DUF6265 family protein [Pseudoalteromonas luteoviolacea]KZN39864.1 hypothetical protein N475_13990 [Pseudoalteromonas luteoviolacea DSM 6061]KZN54747.1 hypothetical protein N474_17710 [Pseudoalteromonas luteoviolacea CPMOR-2]MBE0385802.1 hypothetical protein [Pseudoalteromonas luteoviolacea DSM 6061]TQF70734.1 hypothetical protein FLM44_06500 [Pseudoalteromonas luteoviolacea]